MEVEQHDGGHPQGLLLGKGVYHSERVVAILDILELIGKRMGIEHSADELDVHRVIIHDDDAHGGAGASIPAPPLGCAPSQPHKTWEV